MSVLATADTQTYYLPSSRPFEVPRPSARPHRWFGGTAIQAHLVGDLGQSLIAVQPLPVIIQQDAEPTWIVSDDIFLVYGDGENAGDALNDYVASLLEFYNILKNSEDPFDQKQFAQLQTYIQPKLRRGPDAVQANRD